MIRSDIDPTGRPFLIAGFGLLVVTALIFTLAFFTDGQGRLDSVAASFEVSAGALGIVAATLCVVRWRLTGDARALWVGTAVGIYAVFSIAAVQLLSQLVDDQDFSWVRH